ncbi:MAG: UDP-N-acetylmuramoyl-tripeptide--D-alanyl-D-alanine ligase [Bacteroidales bacterium]
MDLSAIYKIFKDSAGICSDTRTIKQDCLFFALKGDNFNGNYFTEEAFEKGAKYAVVDQKEAVINEQCVLVENSLKTLQQLANYHRRRFTIPMIAITGSNGKTTTKEIMVAILQKKYHVHYTAANLNNHIGVPLTLLNLNESHEISVVEMGANHQGEIGQLCQIAEPDYGLITNVGMAHIEGFGSFEGVVKAKSELYDYLQKENRPVFVNEQDRILMAKSNAVSRITYGKIKDKLLVQKEFPTLVIQWNNIPVKTNLTGAYNLDNINAAIAVGNYFRVRKKDMIEAIEQYNPDNSRSQLIQTKNNTIILDAYNANPTSVRAALENLHKYDSGRSEKIVALGDMLEMGTESVKFHEQVVELLKQYHFDQVILVGNTFASLDEAQAFNVFKDSAQAVEFFQSSPPDNALILLKGSRGIRMERLLKAIP